MKKLMNQNIWSCFFVKNDVEVQWVLFGNPMPVDEQPELSDVVATVGKVALGVLHAHPELFFAIAVLQFFLRDNIDLNLCRDWRLGHFNELVNEPDVEVLGLNAGRNQQAQHEWDVSHWSPPSGVSFRMLFEQERQLAVATLDDHIEWLIVKNLVSRVVSATTWAPKQSPAFHGLPPLELIILYAQCTV
jgi:hypothetical protein